MAIARNLLAGLANSAWSALVGLAVVPFYLKYLGVEAYGLIGFYVTFQALLQLLDMGMSPTINREVARCSAEGNIGGAGRLLHSLAVVYWAVAVAIAVLILLLAPLIANYWLHSQKLLPQTISNAVMLMGLVLAARWPVGLYQGALIGAQRVTISSAISMSMITIGSLGAVAILAFVSATIEAFFIWQACVGFLYVVAMRTAAWLVIGKLSVVRFDIDSVLRVLKFSLGVAAISVAGLVLTQLDKVILSKMLSLDGFGKYMLATTLASGLYILIVPVFNVIYPRFSSLVAQKKYSELDRLYPVASRLLATLLFPSAMAVILLAQPLIGFWVGSDALAADLYPLVSLLLLAYALHGVMHMPYALMLAHGNPRPMFAIYMSLIVVMVPLTIMFSMFYGAMGGAFAQLLLFLFYLFVGAVVTHRRHLKGTTLAWIFKSVGIPLLISALVGFCGHLSMLRVGDVLITKLLVGVMCWGGAILSSVCFSQDSRTLVADYWNKIRLK